MGCSSTYATSDDVSEFFCRLRGYNVQDIPVEEDVEAYLEQGAARINLSLSATAQCDCTLSSWATTYLKNLNIIAAGLMIRCPDCGGSFNSDEREWYEDFLSNQLGLIREGQLDLCDGATGPNYPAYGVAEQGWTPWTEAKIIGNDILRSS